MSYNGWKNWETWNVALWCGNDEGIYPRSYAQQAAYGGRGGAVCSCRIPQWDAGHWPVGRPERAGGLAGNWELLEPRV